MDGKSVQRLVEMNLGRLLKAYAISLKSRLLYVMPVYTFATAVGLVAAVRGLPPILISLQSLLATTAIGLSVYLFNDLMDVPYDKISAANGNAKHVGRPLVHGLVSPKEQLSLIILLSIVGLGVGLSINFLAFSMYLVYLVLGYFYSAPPARFKKRFLLKDLTIAIGGAMAGLAGGAAVNTFSGPVLFEALLFFVFSLGVGGAVVDIGDMMADKEAGMRTVPIVLGQKASIKIAMASIGMIGAATVAGYFYLGFNFVFPVFACGIFAIWIYLLYTLLGKLDNFDYLSRMVQQKIVPLFFLAQFSLIVGVL